MLMLISMAFNEEKAEETKRKLLGYKGSCL
jgi:hypothetical protein